jgi:hypothetical protein
MDVVLDGHPEAVRDVEEALLAAFALGAHVAGSGVYRLTERLQLRRQL